VQLQGHILAADWPARTDHRPASSSGSQLLKYQLIIVRLRATGSGLRTLIIICCVRCVRSLFYNGARIGIRSRQQLSITLSSRISAHCGARRRGRRQDTATEFERVLFARSCMVPSSRARCACVCAQTSKEVFASRCRVICVKGSLRMLLHPHRAHAPPTRSPLPPSHRPPRCVSFKKLVGLESAAGVAPLRVGFRYLGPQPQPRPARSPPHPRALHPRAAPRARVGCVPNDGAANDV
jgi:hypothetical protein